MLTTRAEITRASAAAGAPLPDGDWEVRAAVSVAGFAHARSVRRNGAPLVLTASPAGLVARRDSALRQSLAIRLAARLPRVRPGALRPQRAAQLAGPTRVAGMTSDP